MSPDWPTSPNTGRIWAAASTSPRWMWIRTAGHAPVAKPTRASGMSSGCGIVAKSSMQRSQFPISSWVVARCPVSHHSNHRTPNFRDSAIPLSW